MPNNGKWVRCTCGLSHWGSTEESRRVMLHRCAKNHVDSDDLVLDGGQCRLDSSIFCIMSHTGNHRTHARCKEWLTSAGVPEADIAVVYGYKVGRDYHMGKPIKSSEVLHYGVHHKWFPRVRGLLKKRKEAGKRTTAVWFIEADARSETPMEELVAKLNNPYADRPVRWLGFSKWRHGGLYQKSYGPHCKKQLQGSQCIVFKGTSLKQMHDSSLETMRYSHFDLKVWRTFNKNQVWVPKIPLVGTCGHMSAIMGGGEPQFREGIHDVAKRRRLGN